MTPFPMPMFVMMFTSKTNGKRCHLKTSTLQVVFGNDKVCGL